MSNLLVIIKKETAKAMSVIYMTKWYVVVLWFYFYPATCKLEIFFFWGGGTRGGCQNATCKSNGMAYVLFDLWKCYKSRLGLDTLVAKQSSHNCGKRVSKKKSMALEEAIDEYTQDGTVDLKGNPVLRSKRGGWKACWFVVGKLSVSSLSLK